MKNPILLFHHLTRDLVGDLVTPLVDDGHVDVIDKDGHFSTARWTISGTHSLVDQGLDRVLEHVRLGGG